MLRICRMSSTAGGLSMNLALGGAIHGGKVRKRETQEAISTGLDVLNGRQVEAILPFVP